MTEEMITQSSSSLQAPSPHTTFTKSQLFFFLVKYIAHQMLWWWEPHHKWLMLNRIAILMEKITRILQNVLIYSTMLPKPQIRVLTPSRITSCDHRQKRFTFWTPGWKSCCQLLPFDICLLLSHRCCRELITQTPHFCWCSFIDPLTNGCIWPYCPRD